MPRIFDNIEHQLLPALQQTVELCHARRFLRRLLQPARLDASWHPWSNRGPVATVMPAACWWACSDCPQDELRLALSLADD